MKCLLLIGLLAVLAHSVQGVDFQDCGSKLGRFTQIKVSDCDTKKTVCVLKRNSNATISIDFELDDASDTIKSVVHGIVMGIEMPFKLPNDDGCVDSGLTCPLAKGSYEFSATLPVLKVYPKVKVEVKWQLKSTSGEDIVCVLIPAKIE